MKLQVTLFLTLLISPIFAQLINSNWQHLDQPQWQNNAEQIYMASDGNTPIMAYNSPDTDGAIEVRYFDGQQWMPLGPLTASPQNIYHFDLAVVNGVPTLAFVDPTNTDKVSVVEYNNGSWQPLGSTNFSASYARDIDLIDANGLVTLAYISAPNGQLSVAQFDGYNWNHLGGLHFTASSVSSPQLGYAQGSLYVAANDMGSNASLSVWNFRQGHWLALGQAGITSNAPSHYSFLASNTQLLIAYERSSSATGLLTFDGTQWQAVAASLPPTSHLSLLELNGIPYLALNNTDAQGHFQVWTTQQGSWTLVHSDPTDLQESVNGIAGCAVGNSLVFAFNGLNSGQMSSISAGPLESAGPITGGSNDQNTAGGIVTPLVEQIAPQRLDAYPNPSNGSVTLDIPAQIVDAQLLVRNLQGQVVTTTEVQSNQSNVDLDLPAGLYLLELKAGEQIFQTKLIIQ